MYHVLKPAALLVASFVLPSATGSSMANVAYAHGSPCHSVIMECGPVSTLSNFSDVIIVIGAITLVLIAAFFVHRCYYLQRKDFYVVR